MICLLFTNVNINGKAENHKTVPNEVNYFKLDDSLHSNQTEKQ